MSRQALGVDSWSRALSEGTIPKQKDKPNRLAQPISPVEWKLAETKNRQTARRSGKK
jgi:hypothetical protein